MSQNNNNNKKKITNINKKTYCTVIMYNIFKFLTHAHTWRQECCLEATWLYSHFLPSCLLKLSLYQRLCQCGFRGSESTELDSTRQLLSWTWHGAATHHRSSAFPFPLFNCKQTINIFTSDVSVETLIVGMSCFEWQSLLLYSLLFTIIFKR